MTEPGAQAQHEHFVETANNYLRRVVGRLGLDAQAQFGLIELDPLTPTREPRVVGLDEEVSGVFEGALVSGLATAIALEQRRQRELATPEWRAIGRVVRKGIDRLPSIGRYGWSWRLPPWSGLSRVAIATLPSTAVADVPTAKGNLRFVDSVIREFLKSVLGSLSSASRTLDDSYSGPPVADLFRDAGRAFVNDVLRTLHDNSARVVFGKNVFERVNQIASQPYEGGEGRGTLVFLREDAELRKDKLLFAETAPLANPIWARKMLELATEDTVVLATDDKLFGVAARAAVARRPNVQLRGRHTWTLSLGNKELMEVRLGVPALPRPKISEGRLTEAVRRVVGEVNRVAALWSAVQSAVALSHGTTIIVAPNAAAEAARLSSQGTRLQPPQPLSRALIRSVTRIDGAVLLDPEAQCHAIGVILDGKACSGGTPARGARFNSALRYVVSQTHALAVVVSEDGHVDLLPRLRPSISRSEFEDLVKAAIGAKTKERRAAADRLMRHYWEYVEPKDREDVWMGSDPLADIFHSEDLDSRPEYDRHPTDIVD